MIDVIVLGIGSPFQDDQLGWAVVKRLEQSPEMQPYGPEQLALICLDRPGMRLLDYFKQAKWLILVDAIQISSAVGTLHCFDMNDAADVDCLNGKMCTSSHSVGVSEVVQMAQVLELMPDKMSIYGIEIGEVGVSFDLSQAIQQAIIVLAARIESDILSAFRMLGRSV